MRNKSFFYLCGRFFDGLSTGLFLMALPWVMLSRPDMGAFVALVALTCTAFSFVLTPVFSVWVDRYSRKKILIAVLTLQSLTSFGVLLCYMENFESNWLLAGAQLIFWVFSNLAWSANNAFTQENFDRHEYAAISGKQEVIMQGTTLGAGAAGVVLLEQWGMEQFAAFAFITSALGTVCYLLAPYRRRLRKTALGSFYSQLKGGGELIRKEPVFYSILLLSSLSYPVLTYLSKLVPIWFSEQGVSGRWFAGYYIYFAIGSLLTGLLISRLLALGSLKNIMLVSFSGAGLMLVAMSLLMSPLFTLVFIAGFGFCNALNRISRINWMHIRVDVGYRGRADGLIALFSTLMQNLSYVLIAYLSSRQLTEYGFPIIAAVVLAAASAMWFLIRKRYQGERRNVVSRRGLEPLLPP